MAKIVTDNMGLVLGDTTGADNFLLDNQGNLNAINTADKQRQAAEAAEAATRAAADTTLQANITAEASARTTGDSTTLSTAQAYTDALIQSRPVKDPVRAIATSNITLSGLQTIDGVSLAANDRVLVAGQSTASQNGWYCVDDETEILTRDGFVPHNRLIPGTDALTFNTESGLAEWQPVESVHRFEAQQREMVSMEMPGHSSLSTLDHRWPVERRHYCPQELRIRARDESGRYVQEEGNGPWWTIRRSAELGDADYLIRSAPVTNLPTEQKYEDAFVELVAWFITEGHIRINNSGTTSTGVRIHQSHAVNPDYVARIRRCLTVLFGPPTPVMRRKRETWEPEWHETDDGRGMAVFTLNTIAGAEVLSVAPNRVAAHDFVTVLTEAQLRLFVDTCVAADGWAEADGVRRTFGQKDIDRLYPVQTACTLLGIATTVRFESKDHHGADMYEMSLVNRTHTQPQRFAQRVQFDGMVWCPVTPNGTWLARRHGSVYFTGNTAQVSGWVRTTDADVSSEVKAGSICWVSEGTTNADSLWELTTDAPITLGTTALNFAVKAGGAAGFALQSALTSEATARASADTTLQTNLTTEVSRATAAEALAALKANNLSDLPSAATARTNLGLGTAATQASSAFDAAGAAAAVTTTSIGAVAKGDLALNVKDYGAKGDGTTDDTTAIQAALTAMAGQSGKHVYFPAGTYLVSAALTIPFATGWRLEGASRGSVLIKQNTANTPIIKLTANLTHSWSITDLTFAWTAAPPATDTASIAIVGATGTTGDGMFNWSIQRCTFNNGFRAISHNQTNAPEFWGVHISDCVFGGAMTGAAFCAAPAPTGLPNINIENCYIDANSATEPSIQIANGDNVVLRNLEFNNGSYTAAYGQIALSTCYPVTLMGCKSEAATLTSGASLWTFSQCDVSAIGCSAVGILGGTAATTATFIKCNVGSTLSIFAMNIYSLLTAGSIIGYQADSIGIVTGLRTFGFGMVVDPVAALGSVPAPKLTLDSLTANRTRARGDADLTLVSTDYRVQLFNTTLTANRTVTLPSSGLLDGQEFEIIRTDTGLFTLTVSDPLTSKNWVFGAGKRGYVRYRASSSGEWLIVGAGTYGGSGGFAIPSAIRSVSANYSVVNSDLTILATAGSGGITVTSPAASAGQRFEVKKVDAAVGAVTINPASGTIDGASNVTITIQNDSLTLCSDGSNWWIV